MSGTQTLCTLLRCSTCERPICVILPNGDLQITSRHGGAEHVNVIKAAQYLACIPTDILRRHLDRR